AQNESAEATALAVDVLRCRVDDDIGTERERFLEERRRENVVDEDERADGVRKIGDGAYVDEIERRIGRCLEEHGLGLGCDRLLPRGEIGAVDERTGDAEARTKLLDHVAAGAEERL